MDIEQRKRDFLSIIRRNHMSFTNAIREAERLQHQLNIQREVCNHFGDGICRCTGYVEGVDGICGSCGDVINDHNAIYPTDVYKPIVEKYVGKPFELTIAIYSHGCDKPVPLLEGKSFQAVIVPRVQMLSAVSHSCFNYGSSESYLTMLQTIYRNKSIDQFTALEQVSRHMNPHVQALQGTPVDLRINKPSEAIHRDHFVNLPQHEIYRIHRPIIDREYSFNKDAHDIKENKQFGIYIVQSTIPDDDITFSYTEPVEQLSQSNNILSPSVSSSLRRNYTELFHMIMKTQKIEVISLQDILFCLFQSLQWDTIRVIDIGCRATCDQYNSKPELRRLTSGKIIDLENQPLFAGKKKKTKKSKKMKKIYNVVK